jgi:hypothetical protein
MRKNYLPGTLEQRLAARSEIDPLSGCHVWQGACNPGGYPTITLHRQSHLVHRLAWTLRYGTIPKGFVLCHRCAERRCINPDHHFVGTQQDNMADMGGATRGADADAPLPARRRDRRQGADPAVCRGCAQAGAPAADRGPAKPAGPTRSLMAAC